MQTELTQSQVAELLRENNKLLAEVAKHSRPVNTAKEMRELMTAQEFETAKMHKVAQHSLEECLTVEAEVKGFDSITAMLEYQSAQREKELRRKNLGNVESIQEKLRGRTDSKK